MTGDTLTVLDLSTQNIINIVSIGLNTSLTINFSTVVRRNEFNKVSLTIPEESITGYIDLSYNGTFTLSGISQSWDKESVINYVNNLDTELTIGKTVQFPYQDGYVIMTITGMTESTIPTKNNSQTLYRSHIEGPITFNVNTPFNIGDNIKINPNSWDLLIT